jgi:3-methyl-2-oxobutanoate hydroxymethyltransferase
MTKIKKYRTKPNIKVSNCSFYFVLLHSFIKPFSNYTILQPQSVPGKFIGTTNFYVMSVQGQVRSVTTHVLQEMKNRGQKISMLTAYDYSMARILDSTGIDVILVGDSASNVMAGYTTTLPITLDEMIYHASSVVRAVKRALVVVDLPFGTYQGNSKKALASSIRIMKETGAGAIKIEGGAEIKDSVERILSAGIPVMGHLGLIPQSINKFGTYVVRARDEAEAQKLLDDALLLQEVGCFGIVLEKIPASLGEKVAKSIKIPTIGIGAGGQVDGQVLVLHDMLGITQEFSPRFLRRYHNLSKEIKLAVEQYVDDVRQQRFPNENEQY